GRIAMYTTYRTNRSYGRCRLFSAGAVAGRGLAVVVDVTGGPEQAARHEIEIARIGDRVGIVAEHGAEDAGLAVIGIGPHVHPIIRPGTGHRRGAVGVLRLHVHRLQAVGQRMSRGEDLDVVIMLFLDRRPILHSLGDRALLV